jgi:hypothetical protein
MARRSRRWVGRCSFCGKRHDQVRRVIGGPHGILICNECVALCNSIINEERPSTGSQPATPNTSLSGPWWCQALVAVGRLLQGRPHRRPSWRGTISTIS